MHDLANSKKELRKQLLEKRKSLADREKKNCAITERLLGLNEYKNSEIVCSYISTAEEVLTLDIITAAIRDGKKVFAPVCISKHEMEFYRITHFEDLHRSKFGILEPDPNTCEKAQPYTHTICIVPAISFDRQGYRIGYGGGYYDRFLERSGHNMITIGLCFEEMVVEKLPREMHDQKVDMIITNEKVY